MSSILISRTRKGSHARRGLVAAAGLAVLAAGLAPLAASANPGGTGLVINEVYGAGGNAGAAFNADFVELLNPGAQPVELLGTHLTYRASTGATGQSVALRGTVPAGGTYLVRMSDAGTVGAALPAPDQVASPTIAMAAGGGQVVLSDNGRPVTAVGNFAGRPGVVDMVGLAGASSFETATGPTATAANSAHRASGADTDDNSADFVLAPPTPVPGGGRYSPVDAGSMSVAQVQGAGDTSPFLFDTVSTRGVVTAAYPTGGLSGFFVQTEGTGAGDDPTRGSDGLFVFGSAGLAASPVVGDFVQVVGTVSEFSGLTQVVPGSGGVTKINDQAHTDPVARPVLPTSEAAREASEGELFAPANRFTVTNTFTLGTFGEVGLASGDTPLIAPTEVARPGTAAAAAVAADNAARGIVLDDGASANYNNSNTSLNASGTPSPWINATRSVRVGAGATLVAPVVLDFRNSVWKVQPQQQVTGLGESVATFENTRPANAAPAAVGGDLQIASFNVLNYFPTTGEEFDALPNTTCTYNNDRAGARIAVGSCNPDGPRGAATAASFARQQAKTVTAIKGLEAEIVGLEEIENSAKFGKDRDFAISNLVDALNASTAPGTWAYAPSPAEADRPTPAQEDVIRTGFIYQPAAVELVGGSKILIDEENFDNAREPLAQAFKPAGTSNVRAFSVIVNHFKSKGSGVDDGTGQGAANPDRVGQASALVAFAESFAAERGTEAIFLAGDFNSYTQEDPMYVLYGAGYEAIESDTAGEETYSFSGLVGSLDHVLGNEAAMAKVTGADVWNINSTEPIAYQYRKFNVNATPFFDATNPFATSDHNPEIVGLDTSPAPMEVQVLGTNDFHGRLLNNSGNGEAGAAVLSGAVKQLRAANPNTVFAAAGDLIGASTFESFIQQDKPTIDALNEAGLDVSAAGNHEFDAGYDDLVNRVLAPYDAETNPYGGANWEYIAANVRKKSDGSHALPESFIKDFGDVEVGFVGAVTEALPSLVTPAGIAELDVTDVVEEANATADRLRASGADVIVLLVHEGATGTSYASATDQSTAFGRIVNGVDGDIDAIVSGHTHLAYNHSVPVQQWIDEGRAVTERPVVSAGQYGTNLNKLVFSVDRETGRVTAKTQSILPLKTVQTANYPVDQPTKAVVDAAVAKANELGARRLGDIGGPFNRAKLANVATENRGGESTLGNLVAEVQQWATESETTGSAQIAFMNPGGLRADMTGSGTTYPTALTYRQAALVQPFANTLVNMRLTGAQLKTALEQQWQPAGSSRPFLRLGISKGFTYTYDPSRPEGSRVTAMYLDGTRIDTAATYSVTVNSFLASGGDNFRVFAQGAQVRDTGRSDLQAMVDYMATFADTTPLPVDYTQRSVGYTFPADAPASYLPGDTVRFDLSSLAMTAPGDQKDNQVAVALGGVDLGTFPVDNTVGTAVFDEYGTSSVAVVVPAGTAAGTRSLTVTGLTTGTTAHVPLEVGSPSRTSVVATSSGWTYGTDGAVEVAVTPTSATGVVKVFAGERQIGAAAISNGVATVTVPGTALRAGLHTLGVRYEGDGRHAASTSTVTLSVSEAVSSTDATVTPTSVKVKKGTATISVDVTAVGVTPTGTVTAYLGGQQLGSPVQLSGGRATLVVGPFDSVGTRSIELRYSGDPGAVKGSSDTVDVQVVKARPRIVVDRSPQRVVADRTRAVLEIDIRVDGNVVPTGDVMVRHQGRVLERGRISDRGVVELRLPRFDEVGEKELTIVYSGDDAVEPATRVYSFTVRRRPR